MAETTFPSFAPYEYWLKQVINPWQFQPQVFYGPVTYQDMQSADIGLEKEIVERVASYGRQLGRIGDVLQVLIDSSLRDARLNPSQRRALDDFAQLRRDIDTLRRKRAGVDDAAIERLRRSLAELKERDGAEYERVKKRLRDLLG
jgi:hypothetical protein